MRILLPIKTIIGLFCLLTFSFTYGTAQPIKDSGNIYTKWITLALLGKNQAEIEFYFRNEKEVSIQKVKQRIRFTVLDNLRRSNVKSMISRISDADDFNVIITKILLEIRFVGLEHDEDLLLSIKEEFGIELHSI